MIQNLTKKLQRIGLVMTAFVVGAAGTVLLTASPASAGTVCERPMLRESNVRKECVRQLQIILNIMRPISSSARLAEDGYFGSKTETAVKKFQFVEHISPDGIVGPITWSRLCEDQGVPSYHWVQNSEYSRYHSARLKVC